MPSGQMPIKGRCPIPCSHLHQLGTIKGPINERHPQGLIKKIEETKITFLPPAEQGLEIERE